MTATNEPTVAFRLGDLVRVSGVADSDITGRVERVHPTANIVYVRGEGNAQEHCDTLWIVHPKYIVAVVEAAPEAVAE